MDGKNAQNDCETSNFLAGTYLDCQTYLHGTAVEQTNL